VQALHLIKLNPDGSKISKIFLGAMGNWPIALIPPGANNAICIGEGIETVLSAVQQDALGPPGLLCKNESPGQEIVPRDQQTPQALAAHHRTEIEKWTPMVKKTFPIVDRLLNVRFWQILLQKSVAVFGEH